MTARQVGLLRALMDTGGVRDAAAALGISYTSARNTLAELKAKLGVDTVPMMIGLVGELMPDGPPAPRHRHDLFSLSERQFAIARSISIAKTRQEIAATLKISQAVLDAEFKEIYLILGVRGAGELLRVMAAAGLQSPDSAPELAPGAGHALPIASINSVGRRIGYSDFGPKSAAPVLILHSTITSRAPPTRLVTALQQAGFRPLAIDRPGFGDTDAAPQAAPHTAAEDVAAVFAALGLAQIDVIARGSGHAAMMLQQHCPGLVRRAVLVNPTPSIAWTSIDRGPLGAVKRAFAKRPWAVETMIRLLLGYATPQRLHDGMARAFRESPPDIALVHGDPQFAADYMRAVRGFAQGKLAGYVAEQTAWAAGLDVVPIAGLAEWRIVQGRHFVLHDPAQAMAYWNDRLPDTPVIWVAEAGQMLAYSHPLAVVDALKNH